MNVFKMIDFIGTKNPNYTYEKVKDGLPSKPVKGKGYLNGNGRQGEWVSRYDYGNGELVINGSYKDDKKFGEFEEHFKGKLFSKGSYKNGEKDGIWYTYLDKDKIYAGYTYKNGLYHGEYMIRLPTGGFELGVYENGEKIKN